jgi:hypothetical protein
MLISRKSREEIAGMEIFKDFGAILEQHKEYMELGSLGPDLPYYESRVKGIINLLRDRSDKPMGVDQWSYQLHSKDPNIFPLKMLEIMWRESNPEMDKWEEDDQQRFAFICGFLTHIAADQIIHPLVNEIAGPYYKGGDHREVHRKCEIYQDVVIYQKIMGNDLKDEKLNRWCDIKPNSIVNTPIWFRYFLQKAFIEAHAVAPPEDSVEEWVDGILFMLRFLNKIGPYIKAARDYSKSKEVSEKYKKFYSDPNYEEYFENAIQLSTIYILAAFVLYDAQNVTDEEREGFKKVVQNADLSAPLQKDIYRDALKGLEEWGKAIPNDQ